MRPFFIMLAPRSHHLMMSPSQNEMSRSSEARKRRKSCPDLNASAQEWHALSPFHWSKPHGKTRHPVDHQRRQPHTVHADQDRAQYHTSKWRGTWLRMCPVSAISNLKSHSLSIPASVSPLPCRQSISSWMDKKLCILCLSLKRAQKWQQPLLVSSKGSMQG